jgi:hypothetical protein
VANSRRPERPLRPALLKPRVVAQPVASITCNRCASKADLRIIELMREPNPATGMANWERSQLIWRWLGCSHNLVSPPLKIGTLPGQ